MSMQDEALAAMGVDVNELPDNLETTKLQAMCDAMGIDTSDMTDNLKSSYYNQIATEYTGGGGGVNVLNDSGIIKQEHLPEGYPYQKIEEELAYTITVSAYRNAGGVWVPTTTGQADKNFVLVEGETFVFNFNGIDSEVTIKEVMGGQCLGFGNESVMSAQLPDTGESFFIYSQDKIGSGSVTKNVMVVIKNDGTARPTKMTLTRVTEETVKLDPKYLPDGYPYSESTVFLPETTPVFSEDMGGFVIMSGLDASMFTKGQTYTVNWNGTNYETKALLFSDNGMNFIILGDMGAMQGVPTTGEPFAVMILDAAAQAEMGIAAMVIPIDGSASVTLSIIGEILTPVDAKFLPNAPVFVDVYGTIGGTYRDYGEKPENISKQSHTNAEILALAKEGKNVIIRNYDSETATAFKCYNLSEVDFAFALFTNVYFNSSQYIGRMIEVLINGTMTMQETQFA